ncbi:dihydrofolate reductase family protein [Prolixibacter denitrificans]|jgi:dihydrofolate reductase|uniref:Dihydrofolate reductase n=1 Tax=Prolixibacter denitrificans TaxID=1541063 RepID=A0A2P8C754_9BACT|nr:dihydrofolate reductase family protein [Prolixibacter denitrificans]PSK80809.1 dihydrofolate reductase [Prolixibacter denitrificans]GET22391.1 riboflavin biosynthesis protein RibD [Prolixibacter denitrificans]
MGKLHSFQFITLNGFLNDPNGDISWHRHGTEENQFANNSMQSGTTLLFGRKTYEMMASYWPTPLAAENSPEVAQKMNIAKKIVFSRTLKQAGWENTLIANDAVEEMKRLKETSDGNFTLLGSGTILTLFAAAGLIDQYMVMIDPVAIGAGSAVFGGIPQPLNLELTNVQSFKSGVVLLSYRPLQEV